MKKRFARILPQGKFARRVAVLVSGTALGQLLVVAASPILTRLYAPGEFGLLAVYVSLLGMIVVVASLRYQMAIPLPESDIDGANLLALSGILVLATSALCAIPSIFFPETVVKLFEAPELAPYLWLLPLSILGAGTYQAFSYWAIRTKQFRGLAKTRLAQAGGGVTTHIALGAASFGTVGLLMGDIVGRVSGSGTLIRTAMQRDRQTFRAISLPRIRHVAIRYRRFLLLSSPSALFNALGQHLPVILIARFYGVDTAGLYALCQRTLSAPLTLIGQAVAQVYLSEVAVLARRDQEALRRLFVGTLGRLLALAAIPVAPLVIAGPQIFALVFGEDWRTSGEFARLLSLHFVAQFAANPLSQTLTVLERQDLQLMWDIGRVAIVGGTLIAADRYHIGVIDAIGYFGIASASAYTAHIAISYLTIKQNGDQ